MRAPIIDKRAEVIVGVNAGIKGNNLPTNGFSAKVLDATAKSILHVAAWQCNGSLSSQYFRLGGFSGTGSYIAYLEPTSLTGNQIRVRFQNETGTQQNSLVVGTGREAGIHAAVWYLNAAQTQAFLWVDSVATTSTSAVNVGAANQLVLTNAYISSDGQNGSRNEFSRVSGSIFTGVPKPSNATVTQLLGWARGTVSSG